jgi:hypothetical protein
MGRDEDSSMHFTWRGNLVGCEECALHNHGGGTVGSWSDEIGGSFAAYDAAVLFGRVARLPGMLAAAVGRSLRGLQAHSKWRKQGDHQEDGYRRALEKAVPHEGSLPRKQPGKVSWITRPRRECACNLDLLRNSEPAYSLNAFTAMALGARPVGISVKRDGLGV